MTLTLNKMASEGDQDTVPITAAISVKLPEFTPTAPKYWFRMIESTFRLKRITSDISKYDHTLAALPKEVGLQLILFIDNPPASNKYETLKEKIIEEFQPKPQEAAAMILDLNGLGDLKPSHLLTKILTLLPEEEAAKPSIVIKEIFLRQLPPDVRAHLTDKHSLSLSDLAKEADQFFTNTGRRISALSSAEPAAHPVQQFPHHAQPHPLPEPLLHPSDIAALQLADRSRPRQFSQARNNRYQSNNNFNNPPPRFSNRPRNNNQPNRSYNHTNSAPPTRQSQNNRRYGWCNNHIAYREATFNCQQPCNYPN